MSAGLTRRTARFDVRFMIGGIDSMGVGITFTEVARIVLVGPNRDGSGQQVRCNFGNDSNFGMSGF